MTTWVVPANPAHRLEQTSQRGEGMDRSEWPHVEEMRVGNTRIRVHMRRPPVPLEQRSEWFAKRFFDRDPVIVEFYRAWYECAVSGARRE